MVQRDHRRNRRLRLRPRPLRTRHAVRDERARLEDGPGRRRRRREPRSASCTSRRSALATFEENAGLDEHEPRPDGGARGLRHRAADRGDQDRGRARWPRHEAASRSEDGLAGGGARRSGPPPAATRSSRRTTCGTPRSAAPATGRWDRSTRSTSSCPRGVNGYGVGPSLGGAHIMSRAATVDSRRQPAPSRPRRSSARDGYDVSTTERRRAHGSDDRPWGRTERCESVDAGAGLQRMAADVVLRARRPPLEPFQSGSPRRQALTRARRPAPTRPGQDHADGGDRAAPSDHRPRARRLLRRLQPRAGPHPVRGRRDVRPRARAPEHRRPPPRAPLLRQPRRAERVHPPPARPRRRRAQAARPHARRSRSSTSCTPTPTTRSTSRSAPPR